MKKCILGVVVGLLSIQVQALVLHTDQYPTQLRAQRYLQQGLQELNLRGDLHTATKVDYPASSHIRALKKLDGVQISLNIHVSSFPSSSDVSRLNELGENVEIRIEVNNCISKRSEVQKLLGFTRPVEVQTLCARQSDQERANKIRDEFANRLPRNLIIKNLLFAVNL